MLAGLGLLAIPGLGPVIAAGWLVSTLVGAGAGAAAGAVVGSLAGSLTEIGVSEADAHAYAEGVRRGGTLVTVRADEVLADRVIAILDDEGTVDLNERSAAWRREGWTGYEASRDMPAGYAPGTTGTMGAATATSAMPTGAGLQEEGATRFGNPDGGATDDAAATIPVVEEDVRIGKREVGGGRVRVRSYVTERPVEEQVDLRQERVSVERRPVDRPLDTGEAAFQDREITAVERGEEAVIDKRARVVEEVALNKDVDTRTETVRDTVRQTEVEVEDDLTRRGAGVTDTSVGTTGRER
jgi:uncharacterized protein (TIGR02271 family)